MASNSALSQALPAEHGPLQRADEVTSLLNSVQNLLTPFIRRADLDATIKPTSHGVVFPAPDGTPRTNLVDYRSPQELSKILALNLPETGKGQDGLLGIVEKVLQYSVNTWDQGFLDKLYASPNAVGLASDLILSALNTNLHVYAVSPALTLIEKHTVARLAQLFDLPGPHAGGISTQGGSASNLTAVIIARNTLFPSTKTRGLEGKKLVLFTSAHGHYSIMKAAMAAGLGTESCIAIPVDSAGRMIPSALETQILTSKKEGKVPFFVNATAGTTVLGAFDPFPAIADLCVQHGLWMHVDGSWGGSVAFCDPLRWKIQGLHLANSIAFNPHKMLGVPVTCSFLLGRDMQQFHAANSMEAGYLFHGSDDNHAKHNDGEEDASPPVDDLYDLADLTLQCGRRGDSLKLFLAWTYYGTSGFSMQLSSAFAMSSYLASLVADHPDLVLVSENPPPCLQVCFRYIPCGMATQTEGEDVRRRNTKVTRKIVSELVGRGFMVDWAPGDGDSGGMVRVVVNVLTRRGTVEGLVGAVGVVGGAVWKEVVGGDDGGGAV
ncbi:MAG: hypothetical protein M1834_008818 [Cirrosporium novae-zelandiae]|nr:MAG: hypothetical protein M1834_008818 [Cirrosporium novae-zelandiae]